MRKLFGLVSAATLALATLAPATLQAQEIPKDAPHGAEVAAAAATGARLYAFDQAAWHGTDKFVADMEVHGSFDTSWLRGFMVLDGKDGRLDAVFYGEDDGEWLIAARYAVEGSTVLSGGLLEGDARLPLSEDGIRMAQARDTAFQNMRENDYRMCADANPNTVVFPPDADGEIAVYVLTPFVDNDGYPLGGHYRFTIGADDAVRDSRRFLNSCFNVPIGSQQGAPEGSSPVGVFVTHLLDEYPTEVHFFASYYVPLTLMVGTVENEVMWSIEDGELESVDDFPSRADN